MTLPTFPPGAALDALTGALCKGVRRFDTLPHEVRATYCQPCPVRLACIAQGLHEYEPHTWGVTAEPVGAKKTRTALAQQRRAEKDDDPRAKRGTAA